MLMMMMFSFSLPDLVGLVRSHGEDFFLFLVFATGCGEISSLHIRASEAANESPRCFFLPKWLLSMLVKGEGCIGAAES